MEYLNDEYLGLNMYVELIEEINKLQKTRLSEITLLKKRLRYEDGPSTKVDGMYWIYTNYSDSDLLRATPCSKKSSINFSDMILKNKNLLKLCNESIDGFRLVYNGIGGVGPNGGGGLRERIFQEYRGGSGTGSLAIMCSSLSDISRWRVSYVLWSEIPSLNQYEYNPFKTAIEGLWRIRYGWPILCTK